jgi:phosphatidylserine/phosphatidylglycerophosphate/cardiolipin synthase-like enzyme
MTSARTSNVVKMHQCVVDSLRKAIDPQGTGTDQMVDDPFVYRQTLDACLASQGTLFAPGTTWVESAITKENIAPLFSPDPAGANAAILVENINRVQAGGKIYGAMQHFLHYGIAQALRSAVGRGVDVSLVMDDDIITGESEVPGVRGFYDAYLKQSVSGMKVQFLVTNAVDHQLMHNKFLVMENVDGTKTRVFSGAGHFTDAGLHDNYENFYLSQNDSLSKKYAELFGYLWPRSITEQQVNAPAQPVQGGTP